MKVAKSKLKGVYGFKPRQRVLFKPYNSDIEMTEKQRTALNELINEYGYAVQTEIV